MATSSHKVAMSEKNANTTSAAKSGVKVMRLTGPAVGKTGQRNTGKMGGAFRGRRG